MGTQCHRDTGLTGNHSISDKCHQLLVSGYRGTRNSEVWINEVTLYLVEDEGLGFNDGGNGPSWLLVTRTAPPVTPTPQPPPHPNPCPPHTRTLTPNWTIVACSKKSKPPQQALAIKGRSGKRAQQFSWFFPTRFRRLLTGRFPPLAVCCHRGSR